MGSEIHAVRDKEGVFSYREWNNTSDGYTTPSLDEEEMTFYLVSTTYVHTSPLRLSFDIINLKRSMAEAKTKPLNGWAKNRSEGYNGNKKDLLDRCRKGLEVTVRDLVIKGLNEGINWDDSFSTIRKETKDIFDKFSKKG